MSDAKDGGVTKDLLDKLPSGDYKDSKDSEFKKPKGVPRKMLKEYDDSVFEQFGDFALLAMLVKTLYKRHGRGLWMTIAFIELALIIANQVRRFFA